MRQMSGRILLLCVVATVLGTGGAVSAAEQSDRTGHWEFTLPVRYVNGEVLDFEGGTTIDLNSDLGWGFGFGYNMSEALNLNFEFSWLNANYRVDFASADFPPGPSVSATGNLDVGSTQISANYNILPKTITPYISGTIGWNWIDSNIPTGPPQTGCWWDPWYGQICTTYQDTASETGFLYGLGAGVRIEPKPTFFFRVGVNNNWQDFGSYSSSPDFLSYRMELGWKF